MSRRSRSDSPGPMSEKDGLWEKEESASEKEHLDEIEKTQRSGPIENIPRNEKEFGLSEKRALLAGEMGHEGIKTMLGSLGKEGFE